MNTNLTIIGANGSSLDLFNNPLFDLVGADGLTGVSVSLASSTTPNADGDSINNMQTQPRGIVLDLQIKNGVIVETAKRDILRVIKPKQKARLIFEQGERVTEIWGIVQNIEMPRFGNGVIMQISLYCSAPYWEDVNYIALELSRVLDLHWFDIAGGGLAFPAEGIAFGEYDLNMTQVYTNDGDADCGMIITIIALADVTNPVLYKADGSFIGVNDTLVAGDEIIINTNRGKKSITKNGVSIFSKIKQGSTFLQMETGDNSFTIDSDNGTDGNMYFTLQFKRRFV